MMRRAFSASPCPDGSGQRKETRVGLGRQGREEPDRVQVVQEMELREVEM